MSLRILASLKAFKILTNKSGEVVCYWLVHPADNLNTANVQEDPVINLATVDPVPHIKGEPELSINLPPNPHSYQKRSCTHLLNDTSSDKDHVPLPTGQYVLPEAQHRYDLYSLNTISNTFASLPELFPFDKKLDTAPFNEFWLTKPTGNEVNDDDIIQQVVYLRDSHDFLKDGIIVICIIPWKSCMIPWKMGSTFLPMGRILMKIGSPTKIASIWTKMKHKRKHPPPWKKF